MRKTALFSLALCLLVWLPTLEAHRCCSWVFRYRGVCVSPKEPTIGKIPMSIDPDYMPEVNATFLFTQNIGLDLNYTAVYQKYTGQGDFKGTRIATTWYHIPTIFAQYYPFPCSRIQPYFGIGGNYHYFMNTHGSPKGVEAHLREGLGWAGQIGADFFINPCFFINLDIKYLQVNTRMKIQPKRPKNGEVILPLIDPRLNARGKYNMNPVIIGIGIGQNY